MNIVHVTNASVGPAARIIHQPRRVKLLNQIHNPRRIILPPALVKRHPHYYTGMIAESVYDTLELQLELSC